MRQHRCQLRCRTRRGAGEVEWGWVEAGGRLDNGGNARAGEGNLCPGVDSPADVGAELDGRGVAFDVTRLIGHLDGATATDRNVVIAHRVDDTCAGGDREVPRVRAGRGVRECQRGGSGVGDGQRLRGAGGVDNHIAEVDRRLTEDDLGVRLPGAVEGNSLAVGAADIQRVADGAHHSWRELQIDVARCPCRQRVRRDAVWRIVWRIGVDGKVRPGGQTVNRYGFVLVADVGVGDDLVRAGAEVVLGQRRIGREDKGIAQFGVGAGEQPNLTIPVEKIEIAGIVGNGKGGVHIVAVESVEGSSERSLVRNAPFAVVVHERIGHLRIEIDPVNGRRAAAGIGRQVEVA